MEGIAVVADEKMMTPDASEAEVVYVRDRGLAPTVRRSGDMASLAAAARHVVHPADL